MNGCEHNMNKKMNVHDKSDVYLHVVQLVQAKDTDHEEGHEYPSHYTTHVMAKDTKRNEIRLAADESPRCDSKLNATGGRTI